MASLDGELNAFVIEKIKKKETIGGYDGAFGVLYKAMRKGGVNGVVLVKQLVWGTYQNATEFVESPTTPSSQLFLEEFEATQVGSGRVFTLKVVVTNYRDGWVENAMSLSRDPGVEVTQVMEAGKRFGIKSSQTPASMKGLRKDLGLNTWPIVLPDATMPQIAKRLDVTSIAHHFLSVSTLFSPITARQSVMNLTDAFYHHVGAPIIWWVVPPFHMARFERRVRQIFGSRIPLETCSQFIRHLSIWLDPAEVIEWGIEVVEVSQAAGQLLFILPDSYYWGFSQGYNILEQKYLSGPSFDAEGYLFCMRGNSLCNRVKNSTSIFEPPELVEILASAKNDNAADPDDAELASIQSSENAKCTMTARSTMSQASTSPEPATTHPSVLKKRKIEDVHQPNDGEDARLPDKSPAQLVKGTLEEPRSDPRDVENTDLKKQLDESRAEVVRLRSVLEKIVTPYVLEALGIKL